MRERKERENEIKFLETTTSEKMQGKSIEKNALLALKKEKKITPEKDTTREKRAGSSIEMYYVIYYNQKDDTITSRTFKDVGPTGKSHYELHFTSFVGEVTSSEIDYPTFRGFEILAQKKREEKVKATHDKNYLAYQKYINDGKFLEAINFLITTYNLNNGLTNYQIRIVPNPDSDVQMFTGKDSKMEKGANQTIEIEDDYILLSMMNYNQFADFVRAIGHEFVHVKDRSSDDIILTSPEREFRAYYYTVTAENLPDFSQTKRISYINAAEIRYKNMTPEKQEEYKFKYDTLMGIKSAYGEITKSEIQIGKDIRNKK